MRTARIATMALLVVPMFLTPGSSSRARESRPPEAECTKKDVARLIVAFVDAYNRGDVERLELMWAREPRFEWYFVDRDRERPDPHDRATLGPYFSERHDFGDRLKVRSFHIASQSENGSFGFGFRLSRYSDEKGARGAWHGKGSAVEPEPPLLPLLSDPQREFPCVLHVWSMGRDTH